MSSFLKKLVIIVSVVIFILFMSLLIAAWSMGMFSTVTVKEERRGPYYVVTLSHVGSYQGISEKIDDVSSMLSENKINHITACAIFYDDPVQTAVEDLRSAGGFLINDSLKVASPYKFHRIPIRSVIVASIEANPAIAGFKSYPALQDWLDKYKFNHDNSIPTLELYYTNEIVEVELPVQKKE